MYDIGLDINRVSEITVARIYRRLKRIPRLANIWEAAFITKSIKLARCLVSQDSVFHLLG